MAKLPHIDFPELLTRRQRAFGVAFTALMWMLYAYLWLPLVSLAAWSFGVKLAYDVMVRAGGAQALRQVLIWYMIVLAGIVVTIVAWSLLNRWLFAGRSRRIASQCVEDAAIAEYFGVDVGQLRQLRAAQRVDVEIDSGGRPTIGERHNDTSTDSPLARTGS